MKECYQNYLLNFLMEQHQLHAISMRCLVKGLSLALDGEIVPPNSFDLAILRSNKGPFFFLSFFLASEIWPYLNVSTLSYRGKTPQSTRLVENNSFQKHGLRGR